VDSLEKSKIASAPLGAVYVAMAPNFVHLPFRLSSILHLLAIAEGAMMEGTTRFIIYHAPGQATWIIKEPMPASFTEQRMLSMHLRLHHQPT